MTTNPSLSVDIASFLADYDGGRDRITDLRAIVCRAITEYRVFGIKCAHQRAAQLFAMKPRRVKMWWGNEVKAHMVTAREADAIRAAYPRLIDEAIARRQAELAQLIEERRILHARSVSLITRSREVTAALSLAAPRPPRHLDQPP